jgi:hypothetical protein
VGKLEEERPLARLTSRREDNVKIGLKGIGWEVVDWINVDHDQVQWWAVVNTVMKSWVLKSAGMLMTS